MSHRALAERLPDEPRWIDVRGILLSGRCRVLPAGDASSDYVVRSTDFPLAMVVGRPAAAWIELSIADRAPGLEVLAQAESHDHVARILPEWRPEPAHVHTLPRSWRPDDAAEPALGWIDSADRLEAAGLPEPLRGELTTALAWTPVAAWFEAGRPVAFCYPGVVTPIWWDVSVDTLEPFRGRGLAGRCFMHVARRMHARGKRPLWGALQSNTASLRAAEKLGFRRVAGFTMFQRPR